MYRSCAIAYFVAVPIRRTEALNAMEKNISNIKGLEQLTEPSNF